MPGGHRLVDPQTGRTQRQAWAIVWKEDKTSVLKDFIISFGLCPSKEEALGKVEARLKADPLFRRKHAGGVFYALSAHDGLPVSRNERSLAHG